MRKLLAIALLFASMANAQTFKIRLLPTTTTTNTGAYLVLDDATMGKMTVANFLATYIGGAAVTGSGTQNYVPKWNNAGGTAIGNSRLFDNGTSFAIGNASPTSSTAFEINSTTGALLFPRMTTTQKNALTGVAGMVLYDATLSSFDGYAAGAWYHFLSSALTNTHILVGNASAIATDVAMSGDATIANTGAVSVNKILGNTIPANASGALTNNGSGTLSWAAASSGTVTSIATTSGIIGGTITSTGTLKADTSLLATKYYASAATLYAYVAKTGTYSILATDYTINCTSNTFTVTLPTAVSITGKIYHIKNSGSGTITVATTSSQTIDGSTTQTAYQYQTLTVQSNGANWIIL